MSNVHCFTSVSFSYLNRARVLAETVKRHHPDWTLWLGLSDEVPPGFDFDLAAESFDRIIRVQDLPVPNLRAWIFGHNVVELCTAVKGEMLCSILDEGAEKVVYLDPDIAVFRDLTPVVDLLDTHAVILTPHLLKPEPTLHGVLDNEIGSLKHGVYNLGFIAVNASSEGRAAARWWANRLRKFCHEDVPSGLFTDQRWCDLMPAFFEGVHILRDPGYNVACWNLSNRPIRFEEDGSVSAGGQPLRFFHFTKVNTVGEAVLELYSNGRTEVFELLHWYRRNLALKSSTAIPDRWWAFGTYDDGTDIPQSHRVLYRSRTDLQDLFPNPFAAGLGAFNAWCSNEA
jgi:hypothetical protein